jgi:hypothetical protein
MNTIARTFIATVLAAPVVAAPSVAADSVVRVHASNAAGFERFLPALPADLPWLASDRLVPQKPAMLLPDAGSASAWMLSPRPAEAWSAPSIQSPALVTSPAGCRRC